MDYLFNGPSDMSLYMSDAEKFGLALPAPTKQADFEVWPANWPALQMFARLQTQWRTTMSGVSGLDYTAVLAMLRLYEVEEPQAMLEDLQVMEVQAIKILNKGAK